MWCREFSQLKRFSKLGYGLELDHSSIYKKKNRSLRHKLRAVVNDTALAIGGDPAEYAPDPHANLCFAGVADNLGGHLGAFIELDDSKYVWSWEANWSGAVWIIVNVTTVPFPANL